MFVFGSGVLIATPQGPTPYAAPFGSAANLYTSPINVGLVNEVSLDIKAPTKKLYGQNSFPVAIGIGTRSLSGKAKLARISGKALGTCFFGYTPATGETLTQFGENVSAITSHAYTTTNSAHWVVDQGITYASTGLPMTQLPSSTSQASLTAGQYTCAAGVYTFSTADSTTYASGGLLVSYTYTASATGTGFTVTNPVLGPAIPLSMNLFAADPTTGAQFSMYLYNVLFASLNLQFKLEDFLMPEIDFEAYANAAGNVIQLNFGDTA